jgi:hypothetical protein
MPTIALVDDDRNILTSVSIPFDASAGTVSPISLVHNHTKHLEEMRAAVQR